MGTALSLIAYKDEYLNEKGILISRSDKNIVLIKDSVIVTLVSDVSSLRTMFNSYIEKLDEISANIGENECIIELLLGARKKRFLVKDFLDNLNSSHREKRQAFSTIMGVTGLITLGLSSMEALFVNNKVEEMRDRLNRNENNIQILEKATNYNSDHINQLIKAQAQSNVVLNTIKHQIMTDIGEINKLKLEMMCVNAKLSFTSLSVMVDNI